MAEPPRSRGIMIQSYVAISGAGGIGKTTAIDWLTKRFGGSVPVVALWDIAPPDLTLPIEAIITSLAEDKAERDAVIQKHIQNGMLVFADRTCLDPLALAMTLLSESRWRALDEWYSAQNLHCGHHILLTAPHSIVRERRIGRGSSPRTGWLRGLDISQEQYEADNDANWRVIHAALKVPFYEVDFSATDVSTNLDRLVRIVGPLVSGHTE